MQGKGAKLKEQTTQHHKYSNIEWYHRSIIKTYFEGVGVKID